LPSAFEEKHVLSPQGLNKAGVLHQHLDSMEPPPMKKRKYNMDMDEPEESVGKIMPKSIDQKSKNHNLLKLGDLLPIADHDAQIDQDVKQNHNNNVVVLGGEANQGGAVTRIVDEGVTKVIDVQHAPIDLKMIMAETLAVVTNHFHSGGNNTKLSQAMKKLMLAMAQLVEVAERPLMVAAAAALLERSRGVCHPSKLLLHTSRRMAEMAVEVVGTETDNHITDDCYVLMMMMMYSKVCPSSKVTRTSSKVTMLLSDDTEMGETRVVRMLPVGTKKQRVAPCNTTLEVIN